MKTVKERVWLLAAGVGFGTAVFFGIGAFWGLVAGFTFAQEVSTIGRGATLSSLLSLVAGAGGALGFSYGLKRGQESGYAKGRAVEQAEHRSLDEGDEDEDESDGWLPPPDWKGKKT